MDNEIKKAIEAIAKQVGPVQVIPATVTAVDRGNWTVDVNPVDGSADVLDVRLRSFAGDNKDGWVLVPAINSTVLIGFINNNNANAYVASYGEISELVLVMGDEVKITIKNDGSVAMDIAQLEIKAPDINTEGDWIHTGDVAVEGDVVYNFGANLGMVKVTPLVAKLGAIDAKLAQILVDITTIWAAIPPLISAVPSPPSLVPPMVPTTIPDLANDKVTH